MYITGMQGGIRMTVKMSGWVARRHRKAERRTRRKKFNDSDSKPSIIAKRKRLKKKALKKKENAGKKLRWRYGILHEVGKDPIVGVTQINKEASGRRNRR